MQRENTRGSRIRLWGSMRQGSCGREGVAIGNGLELQTGGR